jgi:hypothetical protein
MCLMSVMEFSHAKYSADHSALFRQNIRKVALSVNHMIRNLDRALLYLFFSVSIAIALWSHVFLGL